MSDVRPVSLSQLLLRKVLAVLDAFGRDITYLRLSVTRRCGFSCIYCADRDCPGSLAEELSLPEILRIAEVLSGMGITKVRLTGGEPLMRRDITEICRGIRDLPGVRTLALTTNGFRLAETAQELCEAGVSRINISIDTRNPAVFARITGTPGAEAVLSGIEAALSAGFEKVKINAVLLKGLNDDAASIRDLAELSRRYPLDVRFIELMPAGGTASSGREFFSSGAAVLRALPELQEDPEEPVSGVARLYRLPGAQGRIGIIAPVSRRFCGGCNRIRVTADGMLRPCLLSDREYRLRGLSAAEIRETVTKALLMKPGEHTLSEDGNDDHIRIRMQRIGG